MKASTQIIFLFASLTIACNDLSGSAPAACTGDTPTVVFSGIDAYDALSVQDGFVYVEVPGAGVQRCATSGCTQPTSVIDDPAFVSATLNGASMAYATQIATPDGTLDGEIHAANIDGSGDRALLSSAMNPAYVATSGGLTFWAEDSFTADDTPATIHCIGCTSGGADAPWITGLTGGTYGMFADANDVYVLVDDPTLTSISLIACSTHAPCASASRVVLSGLDRTTTPAQVSSDGTYAYATRAAYSDVVRIDASGKTTEIVTAQNISAIAVDAQSGTLYFGTADGAIGQVKSDGSAPETMLACSGTQISAVAFDATNVYAISGESGSEVVKVAIKK